MTKNMIRGSLAIAVAAILWGLDGVVLTPGLYNLEVEFVVFILHAFPFLIMNLFFYRQYGFIKKFSFKDFALLLMVALLGGTLGTISIVKALFLVNFQELSVVVLLQKLQPVFAISMAAIILKEKLNKDFGFWATIAIIAGYILAFGFRLPNIAADKNTVLAAFYAFLAAFSFGSSTVFGKKILEKYSFKTATFYRYGLVSFIMLFYILLTQKFSQFGLITQKNIVYISIISFTTGSGALFLYYYGLNNVKAVISIVVELLYPISTVFFDYLINNSRLTLVQWLSAVIMIYAIIRLNREQNRYVSERRYFRAFRQFITGKKT